MVASVEACFFNHGSDSEFSAGRTPSLMPWHIPSSSPRQRGGWMMVMGMSDRLGMYTQTVLGKSLVLELCFTRCSITVVVGGYILNSWVIFKEDIYH